jgi:hypothetical protein
VGAIGARGGEVESPTTLKLLLPATRSIASTDPTLSRNTPLPPSTLSTNLYSATMADQHDDLHAEQTEGFKVGEKKTLDEYQNLGEQPHTGSRDPNHCSC